MKRPKVNEVNYTLIYSKNGLEVYASEQDIYNDFRIKLNNHWAKRYYGETAWMDVTRFVHDQAMEFWDFNIEDIYAQSYVNAITELTSRI
jgi:hypothetical protein